MFTDAIDDRTINITGHDYLNTVRVTLTEDGNITGAVTDTTGDARGMELFLQHRADGTDTEMHDVTGIDEDTGARVDITDAYITPHVPDTIGDETDAELGFRAGTLTATTAPDGDAIVGNTVIIRFDMVNFNPPTAYLPRRDTTPLLERDTFEIHAGEYRDTEDRIEEIKEWHRPLRTGTLTIAQEVNGPPDRQVSHAASTLEPVAWLLGFTQGTLPAPIRATIIGVDGDTPPWEFEKWYGTWRSDIGSAFTGANIARANDPFIFLDHGYDRFVDRVDAYKYRECLSWYFDALLQERTVNARTASIASGIETLARRYAAFDEDVLSDTDAVISNLADELGVPVDDLAAFSTAFDESRPGSNAYFYVDTRNAVVHNDRVNVPFDDLFRDFEAALTMFRRVIFHEFTPPGERDRYMELNDLEPRDNRFE
ncbi:hypothetical protein [Halorubrum halodurans]|uniref:ApeA N-terminal domain-containing protein n=1 Tax=Halorubrum halodurans TaxID=1383851 RepID=A0A256IJE6_9EURY|nr:hypothetical protein [Halorubrum halodurans]OYR56634.1 hypothetical protein DJ70_07925 [Halorubrum halodurans]